MLTLRGHTDGVMCVAAADDGHVLTGSGDKTVKVWRGDELVRERAHAWRPRSTHHWQCAPPCGASGSRGHAERMSVWPHENLQTAPRQ